MNKKTHAAHAATLRPIVCIGETLAERDGNQVEAVLDKQIRGSLARGHRQQVAAFDAQIERMAFEHLYFFQSLR